MGYIVCCHGRRKSKSYVISPEEKYYSAQLDYLEKCAICGHSVAQVTRTDFNDKISVYRQVNEKARKLFEKLQTSILFEKEPEGLKIQAYSKFYLNYNEYGVKKRCYANLSSLKIGLFDNDTNLPLINYLYPSPKSKISTLSRQVDTLPSTARKLA